MFKKVVLLILLALFASASQIRVAVATNVSFAINDIVTAFCDRYPTIKVSTILGSSGKLNAQIKRGAPFDVFLSANIKYPQDLFSKGLAISPAKVYAQGCLAIFSVKKRDFSKGIYISKESSISKIAIANPNTAPYGKASVEALKNAKIYDKVKHKFAYTQGVSQTVQYAMSATDIGFVAKSSLFSPKMKGFEKGKNWIEMDKNLYKPIKQGIVIIKATKSPKEAKEFYDFILSEDAKKIFKKYGYL